MRLSPIDYLPYWGVFVVTAALILLSFEVGFRLGIYRHQQPTHEHDAPVGSIVSASLILVAFILAFTFGLAADRFQERRALVVDEANAIERAYLYARLLPEQTTAETRKILKEYVDVAVETTRHPQDMKQGLARSEVLQNALWSQAVAVSERTAAPPSPRSSSNP